jgi:hypothetical protein
MKRKLKDIVIKTVDNFSPISGDIALNQGINIYSNKCIKYHRYLSKFRDRILNNNKLIDYVKKSPSESQIDFVDVLNFVDISKILTSKMCADINMYLGSGSKLDSSCLSIMNLEKPKSNDIKKNNSGIMHHDSVGHRLKYFLPLNSSGNKNYPTSYVKGSNTFKWKTYLNDKISSDQRIPNDVLKQFPETVESENIINFGESFIFDTNGIHSGCYNYNAEPRLTIQLEFSRFKTLLPGKVGQSVIYLNEENKKFLLKNNFIRKSKLKRKTSELYKLGDRNHNSNSNLLCSYFIN